MYARLNCRHLDLCSYATFLGQHLAHIRCHRINAGSSLRDEFENRSAQMLDDKRIVIVCGNPVIVDQKHEWNSGKPRDQARSQKEMTVRDRQNYAHVSRLDYPQAIGGENRDEKPIQESLQPSKSPSAGFIRSRK